MFKCFSTRQHVALHSRNVECNMDLLDIANWLYYNLVFSRKNQGFTCPITHVWILNPVG